MFKAFNPSWLSQISLIPSFEIWKRSSCWCWLSIMVHSINCNYINMPVDVYIMFWEHYCLSKLHMDISKKVTICLLKLPTTNIKQQWPFFLYQHQLLFSTASYKMTSPNLYCSVLPGLIASYWKQGGDISCCSNLRAFWSWFFSNFLNKNHLSKTAMFQSHTTIFIENCEILSYYRSSRCN